jgi:hypothetical protein
MNTAAFAADGFFPAFAPGERKPSALHSLSLHRAARAARFEERQP